MPDTRARKLLPEHARAHNRALVLRTLYRGGRQSRADLARATGLARVTVSEFVAELIADRLVHELGVREDRRPGKPATLLDIDLRSFGIVGIDLSQPELVRGARLDLGGEILERVEKPVGDARGEQAVDAVLALIAELVERSPAPVLGIGVGTPGIVDDLGVVRKATNLGWVGVDLAGIVARRFGVPASLVNDADAAALAERSWGGAGENVIVVSVGRGVGAGLLIDGRLVRGNGFAAGEIGHVVVGTDGGAVCTCGRTGCLETWLSVPSVRRQLAENGAVADVVHDAAGRRLGIALAPVVGVLDVPEIVLIGPSDVVAPRVAEVTAQTIVDRTMATTDRHLVVRLSELGGDGVLRGVTAQVLEARLGIV